jgi:hypothetical protein
MGNTVSNTYYYGGTRGFKFIFYVPDGPSGYYRMWNNSYDTRILSGFKVNNSSITGSSNNYPYFELNCLHVGNWNGQNPNMQSISGSNPSYINTSSLDVQFSPGAAQFSSTN